LVVDYIGIAPQLKEALATYSGANGKGKPTIDASQALQILKEKIDIARDLLHPVDWTAFETNALQLLPECMEHILGLEDGKKRYCDTVLAMTKAFALCGTMDGAMKLAKEIAFHQAVRAPLIKIGDGPNAPPPKNKDYELQQLLSEALVSGGVEDIFKMAGLDSPDISILSDEFLAEVAKMPQKNLAVELLQRLIKDEIKTRFRTNVVKHNKFSELLERSLGRYASRSIEAAQVIEELIAMAKQFQENMEKEKQSGMSPDEMAFYDVLANSESAEELMGEEILVDMAREIATKLRNNVTVDWAVRDSVRARIRLLIKTLLRKYRYPPKHQSGAIELVLKQAELVSEEWVKDAA
jgi:type I restriction enzyme, R subunit